MSEWVEKPIKSLGRVVTGKTPPKINSEYFENGEELFVSPKDLDWDHFYVNETETVITQKALEKFKNQVLPKNSVMFTSLSFAFGKMGIASKNCLTNQQINSIIVNEEHDFRFVYYLLKAYRPIIFSYNSGIDTPIVPKSVFESILVKCPLLPTQQKIAAILSAYDDLIENNKRRIALLEKMAEEIYREWFVRFRFPGYQTAEFEKGIPKGWKELPVADIFDYLEGPGIRNWQYTEAGFPFINIRLIQDGDLNVSAANFISENEAKGKYAHFQLNAEDYVVSTSGTLGRGAVVQQHHLPLLLNTSVIRFRQKVLNTKSFMYEYLKSDLFVKQIETYATGAAQQNFGPMHLGFMKILKPTDEILEKFESICIPLYEQVTLFRKQIVNLKMTKDLLLPRLISGKLSVEDLDIQFPPSMQEDSAA